MSHPLRFFLAEEEIDAWLRRFVEDNDLVVLRRTADDRVEEISLAEIRDDARGQPAVHVGPRAELRGLSLERAIRTPEFLLCTLPLETSKVRDPALRAHVESAICGTQRPCLLMGQITPWKDSEQQLYRAVRTSLWKIATLRASSDGPGGVRVVDKGLRASIGALRWQKTGGELRQAGVKNVRYRVEVPPL